MQVHHKPHLDKKALQVFLETNFSHSISKIENLVEGEDSQALLFASNNHSYVLRINKSDYGFKKDAYAYEHFVSASLPIPKIYQIGKIDNEHAYCISDYVTGKTIQDLDRTTVEALLPQTLAMIETIRDVDISNTTGYGEILLTGNGKSTSWQEWLLTHVKTPDFEWDALVTNGRIKQAFLDTVFDVFKSLVAEMPNERYLIHGDFSSNNVLTNNNKIVTVLDWDAASYGDWLFDIAGAYYWREHLTCMDIQATYYERQLNKLPNYHKRITCYQLRAALIEIYVQAQREEYDKLKWHIDRCQQLLNVFM